MMALLNDEPGTLMSHLPDLIFCPALSCHDNSRGKGGEGINSIQAESF